MTKFCRLCYKSSETLIDIFECSHLELIPTILRCTDIRISKDDGLPKDICFQCIQIISQFDLYKKHCQYIDHMLKGLFVSDSLSEHADTTKCDGNYKTVENRETITLDDNYEAKYNKTEHIAQVEATENKKNEISIYEVDETIKTIIGNNVYSCDICKKDFSFFFDYQDHQYSHNGSIVFTCSKCEEMFDTREKLVKHDSRHKISCHVCCTEVLPKSMPAHLLIHTDVFKCNQCGVRNNSNASLEKHIKARHIGVKGFVCHICGKQSSCQSSVSRHMAYHSSDRPFCCQYCDFRAKSLNIIKVHTSRSHFAEKCVCEVCAKIFKSQHSLQQHRKRIHSNRKHVCDICGKAFIEKYNLNKHLKKHAGQRLHECKICNQEFFTVRKLKEHMHTHRQGCVNCPKCGKEFFYKKYYSKHVFKCMKTDSISCSNT